MGEEGDRPPPPLGGCLSKNQDSRRIKSRFCQSQIAPKLAYFSSKIEKFKPLPRWGADTPPHTSPLGSFGTSMLAPTALDSTRLRRSTSAPVASIGGSTDLLDPPLNRRTRFCVDIFLVGVLSPYFSRGVGVGTIRDLTDTATDLVLAAPSMASLLMLTKHGLSECFILETSAKTTVNSSLFTMHDIICN